MKRLLCTLFAHGGDLAVTAFALVCAAASFTGDPQVYAFPRLVSALMLALCLLRLAQKLSAPLGKLLGKTSAAATPAAMSPGDAMPDPAALLRLLPGAAIIILHITLARELGFYASSALAFFALTTIYARARTAKMLATNAAAALAFTFALHALFSLLLKVQTPSGLLF